MRKQLEEVLDFHERFGCHIEREPTARPSAEVADVRARLLEEELTEYRAAVAATDIVGVADALSDLMYVLLGTYVAHGLSSHAEALFEEVHRSNMGKLGPDGMPILREDGKILKPANWKQPDIASILEKDGGGSDPLKESGASVAPIEYNRST